MMISQVWHLCNGSLRDADSEWGSGGHGAREFVARSRQNQKDSGEGGKVGVRAWVNELEKARLHPSSILCYDWQRHGSFSPRLFTQPPWFTLTHTQWDCDVMEAFLEETVASSSLECTVELLKELFSHVLSLKLLKWSWSSGFISNRGLGLLVQNIYLILNYLYMQYSQVLSS